MLQSVNYSKTKSYKKFQKCCFPFVKIHLRFRFFLNKIINFKGKLLEHEHPKVFREAF